MIADVSPVGVRAQVVPRHVHAQRMSNTGLRKERHLSKAGARVVARGKHQGCTNARAFELPHTVRL